MGCHHSHSAPSSTELNDFGKPGFLLAIYAIEVRALGNWRLILRAWFAYPASPAGLEIGRHDSVLKCTASLVIETIYLSHVLKLNDEKPTIGGITSNPTHLLPTRLMGRVDDGYSYFLVHTPHHSQTQCILA